MSSHIYFFAFADTNGETLVFLRPETRNVARRVSESKWVQSTELDIVNGSFCNLCALALWLALPIFATPSADEPREGRNSCPLLRSCFIGSCHVGVSKRFSRTNSLAVYCLYTHFFGLIRLTNRFLVAVRLFSNRSQMISKCGKNKKVAHEAIAECVTDV